LLRGGKKTFFFLNYEAAARAGDAQILTVPTTAESRATSA